MLDLCIRSDDEGQWLVYRDASFQEVLGFFPDIQDAEDFVRGKVAFDVMLRRGWSVFCHAGKFVAMMPKKFDLDGRLTSGNTTVIKDDLDGGYRADPFTALVDADQWMKEQEAK